MTPDSKDCSLHYLALVTAGIDPMTCHENVWCAIKRQLPGCYQAEAYLMQLIEQVEAGLLKRTRTEEPPPYVLSLDDDVYISKEDAENWQPEAPVLSPANAKAKSSNTPGELSGKSRTAFLKLIKALCLLVARYEQGQPKPGHFKDRKILSDDGSIKTQALRELLQEIDPDTPGRAEQLIKEAFKPFN